MHGAGLCHGCRVPCPQLSAALHIRRNDCHRLPLSCSTSGYWARILPSDLLTQTTTLLCQLAHLHNHRLLYDWLPLHVRSSDLDPCIGMVIHAANVACAEDQGQHHARRADMHTLASKCHP